MEDNPVVANKAGSAQVVPGAASFSKFMMVLQTIADSPGDLDMVKLVKQVPFPRATVHRIITALITEGLVTQNSDNGTYLLGSRLIILASRSWETSDLRTVARQFMESLRDATSETVHLAVPSGNGMAYIDKLESPNAVRMMTRIGARVEFHSTSVGKAYLSALPEERLREIVPTLALQAHTKFTITDLQAFYEEIRKTRERGYSYDHEENEPDIRCFGSTIFNRSGQPVAGVSISIPLYRYDETRHDDYAAMIRQTAQSISAALAAVVK